MCRKAIIQSIIATEHKTQFLQQKHLFVTYSMFLIMFIPQISQICAIFSSQKALPPTSDALKLHNGLSLCVVESMVLKQAKQIVRNQTCHRLMDSG